VTAYDSCFPALVSITYVLLHGIDKHALVELSTCPVGLSLSMADVNIKSITFWKTTHEAPNPFNLILKDQCQRTPIYLLKINDEI
jgi:hypothetical protein